MKLKWEAKCIEAIPKAIPEEEYRRRIAELGEILYLAFCQLHRPPAESIGAGVPHFNHNQVIERTGTHG
ncbi:MAG: hypothetical protein AB1540_06010 [Bdellovibrionota bacterium]